MKRSCKNIDIKVPEQDAMWILDCLERHYKRFDFRRLLLTTGGLSKEEYNRLVKGEKYLLYAAADRIAEDCARQIKERKLRLPPCHIEIRLDKSTGKIRMIGRESAQQQCFDHIAVGAAEEIWKRRILPQQASSIKGRGQYYGVSIISRWISKDKRAENWAAKHGRRYQRKNNWFVKLDAKACYKSMRINPFMEHFKKDCANEDLIWLWGSLLMSHRVLITGTGEIYQGFMVGALPSQWACQYMLSFVYRYIKSLHVKRRGKQIQMVSNVLIFMDDFLLCSPSRKNLKRAAEQTVKFAREEIGVTIKPNWQILNIKEAPIDMMGFLIYQDGHISTRPRVFLRARRIALRAMRKGLSLRQARRILSYKGYMVLSPKRARRAKRALEKGLGRPPNCIPIHAHRINRKLKLRHTFRLAARIVRMEARRKNGKNTVLREAV